MTQSWNDPTTPQQPVEPTFGTQPRYGEEQGTADKAKQEGRQLAGTAQQQAADVKDTAAGEASALKDTAKSEALDVKDTAAAHAQGLKDQAVDAGQQVTETAKVEAQQVVGEARDHILDLVDNVRGEARGRAADAQVAVAGTLAGLTDELGKISRGETTDGPVSQFVGQLHGRGQQLGDWLQTAEPEDVALEVRRFAARRPVAFLAIAAGAGLVAGRLARGAKAAADEQHELEERRRQYRGAGQTYGQPDRASQRWVEQAPVTGPGYAAQTPVNTPSVQAAGHPAIDALGTGALGNGAPQQPERTLADDQRVSGQTGYGQVTGQTGTGFPDEVELDRGDLGRSDLGKGGFGEGQGLR